jgi:hypothetical protein
MYTWKTPKEDFVCSATQNQHKLLSNSRGSVGLLLLLLL